MSRYAYVAVDDQGTRVSGTESAHDPASARAALIGRGLRAIEISKKKNVLQFEITKKRVKREDVMTFSRQLGVFVKAGIPILEALEVISTETSDKQMRGILADMIDSLQRGDTFSDAAAAHPEAFPRYYVGVLQSAELTGALDTVLNQLADYMERDVEARGQLTAALIYPSVVLGMAVVVVIILAGFVLPRFRTFFSQLHAQLPLPTRILLGVAGFITAWWFVIAIVVLLLIVGAVAMRRSRRGRRQLDGIILRFPVIGDLVRAAIVERVCRVLAAMVSAGVALPEAMAVAADSANNAVYEDALIQVRSEMIEGEGIAGPMARTGLFPGAARQMIRVGEETGTLDEQLETAAEFYRRELETKIKRFTSLFEPAVLIVVGIVVGFVAIALVSAMYGIYRQVKV